MSLTLVDALEFPQIGLIRSFFPRRVVPFTVGTGTLIDPRIVLTAGHVVYDHFRGGRADFVDVTLGNENRSTIKVAGRDLHTTKQWVDTDSSFKSPTSSFDFAVVVLPAPVQDTVTPLRFEATENAQIQSMIVNVAGYPAQFYADMYGAHAGALLQSDLPFRFFYPIATLPGMSGGPVFSLEQDSYVIRGIHTSLVGTQGCALRITNNVAGLLQTWIRDLQ